MKKLTMLFVFLFSLISNLTSQYANIYVSSPRGTIGGFQGTIENTVAYCEISGSHLKTDLYLTFSTAGYTGQPTNDSLEIRMYFGLSPQSFITDLWLWIGEDTSKAIIADRFKAQATYNNIVGARKDPALLIKSYGDYYELSIYPITLPGKRKIKLSYVTPMVINDSSGSVALPIWLLNASAAYVLTPFCINIKTDSTWGAPTMYGNSIFTLSESIDSTFGHVMHGDVSRETIRNTNQLNLTFKKRKNFGASNYGEKFSVGNEGTYRFVVEPFQTLGINPGKNILFLIDFDKSNIIPQYTKGMFLEDLKKSIKTQLTTLDSFNIIFTSKAPFHTVSESWIPADTISIKNVFETMIDSSFVLDTVNLSGLLMNGFTQAKTQQKTDAIILVASSDEYTSLSSANALVDTIRKVGPVSVKFFSIDNNDSAKYYYGPNYYYYGNSYLYSQLAGKYGGTTYRIYRNMNTEPYTISYYLNSILETMRWQIEYFEINAYLMNGFTYQNYFSLSGNTVINKKSLVTQVGKFIGDFPLSIDITGFYGGKLYTNKIIMHDTDFITADSSLNTVWASEMLNQFSNNWYARNEQAVDLSIQNRILTYWTAFLALEPGQQLCDTCVGWNGGPVVTTVEKMNAAPVSFQVIRAYPNPFNPSTNLRVRLPDKTFAKDVSLKIFNILGQLVKSLDVSDLNDQRDRTIVWNGKDDNGAAVSSGVYLAVLSTPQKRYTVKLLLMK